MTVSKVLTVGIDHRSFSRLRENRSARSSLLGADVGHPRYRVRVLDGVALYQPDPPHADQDSFPFAGLDRRNAVLSPDAREVYEDHRMVSMVMIVRDHRLDAAFRGILTSPERAEERPETP